jgi:hypothetical protein
MAKWGDPKIQGCENQSSALTRRTLKILLSVAIGVGLLFFQALRSAVSEPQRFAIVFTQYPHQAGVLAPSDHSFQGRHSRPKGSRLVLMSSSGKLTVLTPDLEAAAEASISFDGKRVLFSGKRFAQDNWDIWEMDVDGRNKHQITQEFKDCGEPHYLAMSALNYPDYDEKVRWITFTSTAAGTYEEGGASLATALYARNLEPIKGRGFVTWRITFNLSSDFSPTVLHDGRTLFTSHQRGDRNQNSVGRFLLLASNWDGTGLNLFCGDEQGRRMKTMACEMPDRTLVFVDSDGNTPDGSGELARVSFSRPLHSYEPLNKGEGRYRNPQALPDGSLLVSYATGSNAYGLYFFDFDKKGPGRKVFIDSKWEVVQAVPVLPTIEPTGLISAVFDGQTAGDLQCLNVYDSDRPEASSIRKGDVKQVRLIQGIPSVTASTALETRILGEAPVESDGSFFVRVPADTPFYIQTLNAQGQPLQTMHRWIWVRKGTSRSCIGCHENKELAPENRITEALLKAKPHPVGLKR